MSQHDDDLKQFALALDYGNVPPVNTMVAIIRARKDATRLLCRTVAVLYATKKDLGVFDHGVSQKELEEAQKMGEFYAKLEGLIK